MPTVEVCSLFLPFRALMTKAWYYRSVYPLRSFTAENPVRTSLSTASKYDLTDIARVIRSTRPRLGAHGPAHPNFKFSRRYRPRTHQSLITADHTPSFYVMLSSIPGSSSNDQYVASPMYCIFHQIMYASHVFPTSNGLSPSLVHNVTFLSNIQFSSFVI